jgi:hypothetical protein
MDGAREVIGVAIGFVLRIGIPVGITLMVVYVLRRLDRVWQRDAERLLAELDVTEQLGMVLPCWEIMDCDPKNRADCPAYQDREKPCWQTFREDTGRLKEECLACQLFRNATVLVSRREMGEEDY